MVILKDFYRKFMGFDFLQEIDTIMTVQAKRG